jgi:hypothetical protein
MSIRSAFARRSGAFAVALLALSFSLGSSYVVRADDPVSTSFLQEIFVDPIVTAVNGLEQRLASLEGTLALFASSFSSQHISARELCVSDDSGAQTCITKAQLDALLKRIAQADLGQPTISVTVAEPAPADESIETTGATIETLSAPTSLPKETSGDEPDHPVTTGSLNIESDGAALVWYPNVEIFIPSVTPSEE